MRTNPAFAATAVLTLALGTAAPTAMFTVIRAVLMKPLAYRDPDRLVRVSSGVTPARYEEMKAGARSFIAIGGYSTFPENLALSGSPSPAGCNRFSST